MPASPTTSSKCLPSFPNPLSSSDLPLLQTLLGLVSLDSGLRHEVSER